MNEIERLKMELRASRYETGVIFFMFLSLALGADAVSTTLLGGWAPFVTGFAAGVAVYKFVRAGILHWKLATHYKRQADATKAELKARVESDKLAA